MSDFGLAMAGAGIVLGEVNRRASLKAQASQNFADAASMRAQAKENLRRGSTNMLQIPKEFNKRVDTITAAGAGAGVDVSSYGDLMLNEAGNLLQQAGLGMEELQSDFLLQMKSANNLTAAGNQAQASRSKILGIF